MPEPKEGESRDDFVERCIPIVIDDGAAEDGEQAAAICHSMYEESTKSLTDETLVMFGGAVKALGGGRVGGYLVRFGGMDLEGEYFDADTDFGDVAQSATLYNHGLDLKLGKRIIGKGTLAADDIGVWIDAQLHLRDEYEKAIYGLAEAGKLGWSSGTAPHLVEKEEKGGAVWISRWPLGLDASLTPTPAEPRNAAMPLKSWAQLANMGNLETQIKESGKGPLSSDVTAADSGQDAEIMVMEKPKTEVKTMGETEQATEQQAPMPAPVDVNAIAQAAAKAAVAAYREELKSGPAINNDAGFIVTGDRADRALQGNGFKGWGEFLQAVAKTPMDERLLPLREAEGYFNATKALGAGAIGSLTNAKLAAKSLKAPTGLGELIPSGGGFLVGTDRAGGLLQRVYDVGNLLQRVDMVGISANSNGMTFNAIDETSRVDGSRRGGIRYYWAAEAAEKTASQPKFRQMELKLYKLIGLVYATDELLADASALESWIMQNLPEELAFGAEDAIINGTGAGRPLGILNSGALVSVAKETGQAATTIVAENISKMWARRWLGGRNYVWIFNQDVEPELDNLFYPAGTGGQLVYMPPGGLSGSPYGSIKGRPAFPVEYCPTLGTVGDILLVDLSQYQMIEKGGTEAASSIHVRFVYDETVFRFVYRCDGEPKWDAPLTPYQGTNTVSPFVALATRA